MLRPPTELNLPVMSMNGFPESLTPLNGYTGQLEMLLPDTPRRNNDMYGSKLNVVEVELSQAKQRIKNLGIQREPMQLSSEEHMLADLKVRLETLGQWMKRIALPFLNTSPSLLRGSLLSGMVRWLKWHRVSAACTAVLLK